MAKNPDTDAGEHFLRRWSRRKARVDEEDTPDLAVLDPEAHTQAVPTEAEKPDADKNQKVLTDEDMPPLENLDENSDYSQFMSEGVSEELRRLALRKLWSAARFNVRDGLDDYDDDFRSFEALGDIVTTDMKHQEEMRELRRKQAEEEEQRRLAETESRDEAEEPKDAESPSEGDSEEENGENQPEPYPPPESDNKKT